MKSVVILSLFAAGAILIAGCKGIPASGERQAQRNVVEIEKKLNSTNHPVELTANSSLSNYLAFALLNSPAVQTAFYDWSASVENITIQRSLPDPQITFQSDIADVVQTVMPGFLQEFPGPGKLNARAKVAGAESRAKYFEFKSAVLQTAFNLKRTYYQLGYLNDELQVKHETLSLLENQATAVNAQNMTGGASLTELLRVQNDADRVRTEIANLEDSRRPLLENFKAALGILPDKTNLPTPAQFEMPDENVDADELRQSAFARNPQLKAMEAEVRAAEAGVAVAYKSRLPDFSLGLMADVKASPTMFRPLAGITLPIWRDKIAAEIAQSKAAEMMQKSKLKAAQIDLAVSFAEKLFAFRETGRNLALIENDLIPRTKQIVETARAGYRTGTADFSTLTDAERVLLNLKLEAANERTAHAIALADLSLIVAGMPPANAPLLSNKIRP